MTNFINKIEFYLPENTVDCYELAESKPHWHVQNSLPKTGVRNLHHAEKDETTLQMAYKSASKLLEDISEDEMPDTLIVCTQTPDNLLPHVSACLQHELGLPSTTKCFDISLGCSGYSYGLSIAYGYMAAGIADKVLFVTVDNYSKLIDPENKTSYIIFSDGTAATLLEKPAKPPVFLFGTDGSRCKSIICHNSGIGPMTGKDAGSPIKNPDFQMDGYNVFQFTVKTIPQEIEKLAANAGTTMDDIDLFVFHQASRKVLETIGKKLKIPDEKLIIDLHDVGNTTSSSIPIAMKRAEESGKLRRGDKVMLFGFGIGLSWSGVVLEY
ncbi:3-oxoacyl-ACP synthase III family protein [Maridesulfovibrio hydrothermalis]|uniref:Beta-ketoacyl-acyl-carrier-protein synthase III n=1 Tax=Maridesulfovibrio hydrothermalis AM13 = DSM 14728 TaxID=1121451 RepID=L0R8V2_9BACT|nr:ketoacyl-ACP synthase III [Maridesulfovibrio hydrothermalis]CCO23189.1 Beta-ketoacyl-acyl-carrier-protein synthase III [Maridesulfovibrio hydrothermalis AM13 = DSM 14728]